MPRIHQGFACAAAAKAHIDVKKTALKSKPGVRCMAGTLVAATQVRQRLNIAAAQQKIRAPGLES
jgi:hypothetical protein